MEAEIFGWAIFYKKLKVGLNGLNLNSKGAKENLSSNTLLPITIYKIIFIKFSNLDKKYLSSLLG